MIVRPAIGADIFAVFRMLTPERAAEMTASTFHDSPRQLAEELCAVIGMRPCTMIALHAADAVWPAAIVGVVPFGPGLGGMIWAATAFWPELALASHRWWRAVFVPDVLCPQFRRVEFTALASDTGSRRWLKVLGFTEEGTAYRQGKRGEDFVHMAWLNPDVTVGVHA